MEVTDLIRAALPAPVRASEGEGGLPVLSIETPQAAAEIYFQGAHVTRWQPAAARRPVLWISRRSMFEPGKPIRGGVPVCFPWFGAHPADAAAPAHGFARLRDWTLVGALEDAAGTVTLEMELAGERVSPLWPHRFRITHRISVGALLRMELEVRNEGADAFTFEEALHTYFAVDEVRSATITGLEDTEYLDKVEGFVRRHQGNEPVRVAAETDRIYLDTRATCVIHDPGAGRQIAIGKSGSETTVVWNPWIKKAGVMSDFGDDEWPEMMCVETCNVNVHARTVSPGSAHVMSATISVL